MTEQYVIHPFIWDTANRRNSGDNTRGIKIPDACPRAALQGTTRFSITPGEFVMSYRDQIAAWDAVVTSFFLDTATNVFLYIRTIASVLREGGIWTNLGPLLYHHAESTESSSLELSWEELRVVIRRYFDISEEEVRNVVYTSNVLSLSRTVFKCVHLVAFRNSVLV